MHSFIVIFKMRCIYFASKWWGSEDSDKVCKMKKGNLWFELISLAWFNKFNIVVVRYKLRQSFSDHSIFVRHFSAGTIILAVYVMLLLSLEMIINVLFSWKLIWVLIFIWKTLVLMYFSRDWGCSISNKSICLKENILLIC